MAVDASVIIPTYHRPDLLRACLERLVPGVQTVDRGWYEVIVSDDGTRVSAADVVASFPFARLVVGPGRGPAANRNNGAAHASGSWLIFLDDDCLPERSWLGAYRSAFRQYPEVSIFEGRTFADRPQRTLEETAPINEIGGALWSCNLAVKRDVFNALGRFEERFPYATLEDLELRLRVSKAGLETRFIREAAVCHPWRPLPRSWAPMRQFRESFKILLDLHPDYIDRYPPGAVIRGSVRTLLTETFPRALRYRSGIGALVRRHVGELLLEFDVSKYRAIRKIRRALSPSSTSSRISH